VLPHERAASFLTSRTGREVEAAEGSFAIAPWWPTAGGGSAGRGQRELEKELATDEGKCAEFRLKYVGIFSRTIPVVLIELKYARTSFNR
jgi:hypothetical protein